MNPPPELWSPAAVLSTLPWALLFAWVARRLLGARRLSLRTTLSAGVGGYLGGLVLAWWLVRTLDGFAFALAATVFALSFIMIAVVALELVADRAALPVVLLPSGPRLPRPWRALRRRLGIARRFAEVARIALAHGLGGVLGLDRRGDGADSSLARRAADALDEAGGMFIKLGQLLSTRVDIIPLAAASELARLQEHAAPADPAAVRAVVEQELGRAVETVFAVFDWSPAAAASLGQVHFATLLSGESVAVKVQRPGIAEVVERDLAIVDRFARLAESRTAWGRAYRVTALAADFGERLRDELNYRQEATSAAEVASGIKHLDAIHVHRVWEELSTSRLLVMERFDGVSVSAIVDGGGVDVAQRAHLADTLLRAELEPMLAGERFHADPHPGNVFLLSDGRVGLLDFGATGRLDAFERRSVTVMLQALRAGDPTLLRESVTAVADTAADIDVYAVDHALAQFLARHVGRGATPDAEALSELLGVFSAHGIALPPTTTTMFRAMVTLEGTLQALVPGYQVVDAALRLGGDLTREQLQPDRLRDQARDELVKLAPLLQRAPRHLDRIATLVERGELRGSVSLFSEPSDVRLLTRLVNRGVLAVIGSTLGVVSAVLLGTDGGPLLAEGLRLLDLFGYAGLFAGAVLILRVVLAVVHDEGP